MKQIPGNIYYINNKTYVGHVNDLKTVVYDTSKLLGEKREIVILNNNSQYQIDKKTMNFLKENGYKILIEDLETVQKIIENKKKRVYLFVYDEDLVKTLNSYNKVAMKKIDKKIDYKKYNERLFFKEIEVRKIFKSVKEINEIEVEEIDFATKSINFSIDLLTYVIKEGNPTDKAISMFIEKVIVLKDKICTEQLHDEHARDLMGVISVSNIIGFTSKEVEELKKILETKSYSQIIENQEIIEKYYNEKNFNENRKKIENKKRIIYRSYDRIHFNKKIIYIE